ncbi:MAG: multicopper oxidase domain-containing protein [bacterium]
MLVALAEAGAPLASLSTHDAPLPPRIEPNDNRNAAGLRIAGEVRVVLRARTGRWYPDADRRPAALTVAAFAEGDAAPTIPGPLIRVRAGTRLRITVINALDGNFAGQHLVVHGLYAHPASTSDTASVAVIRLAPGEERTVEFEAGEPGTYHYWAAFTDSTMARRPHLDAGLSGAFVVDPATGPIQHDRIFVLSRMELPAEGEGAEHQPERFATAMNGLSWPYTERIDANVGDTVHWRWINATNKPHPMHLHGFFFHVETLGDERKDTTFVGDMRELVVTERMIPGATMTMTWVPERTGNWLMHCHLQVHTGPDAGWGFPDIPGTPPFGLGVAETPPTAQRAHDMERDMAGLIVGIRVHPAPRSSAAVTLAGTSASNARHTVRLGVLGRMPGENGVSQMATRVDDPAAPGGRASSTGLGVGPAIVLHRGEPARITVVNESKEMTAVHWHGIELESYFDGVAGWTGGAGGGGPRGATSPMIAQGSSFDALMTPPRSGTFIYHAHTLRTSQMADGLYGPLIVLEPREVYDPSSEILLMIGGPTTDETHPLFLNGGHAPAPMTIAAGRHYRVRIVNIGETNDGNIVVLDGEGADAKPVTWRATAKDAITLPAVRATMRPAKQKVMVGETYDFDLAPEKPGVLRVKLYSSGHLMAAQTIVVQ